MLKCKYTDLSATDAAVWETLAVRLSADAAASVQEATEGFPPGISLTSDKLGVEVDLREER